MKKLIFFSLLFVVITSCKKEQIMVEPLSYYIITWEHYIVVPEQENVFIDYYQIYANVTHSQAIEMGKNLENTQSWTDKETGYLHIYIFIGVEETPPPEEY